MTETEETIDEVEIILPDDVEDEETEQETSERKLRWPLVLFLGALLGFGASFGASWFTRPTPYDDTALRTSIEQLGARITDLETAPDPDPVNLDPIIRRLRALENAPEPVTIDENLISRMEALQASGFDMPPATDLSGIETRLEALEARPVPVFEPYSVQTEIVLNPETLPRFPAQRLRDAARELDGQGLLGRVLSSHVRIKGEESPQILINQVENAMRDGRASDAITTFDRLPDSLQSLARAWRADMMTAVEAAQ